MDSVGAIYSVDDTIVAIASAAGGAARGLVRLSGPRAAAAAATLLDRRAAPNEVPGAGADLAAVGLVGPEPRVRTVGLRLPALYAPLPADWYYWPVGRSYTGQEVVELHTIGSPPLLDALVRALCAAGARLAQPGEFTLRAFLSGRIDLTQAEAVLGVIDAGNRRQWETAVRQLAGGVSRPLGALRAGLLDLLADIEAGLDFADEEIHFVTRGEIEGRLAAAIEAAEGVARQLEGRRLGGDRPRAVLVGPPNAGKSSLFNALVQRSAALVADTAGTTRDYLTAQLDCDGMVWELIDTPGVAPLGQIAEGDSSSGSDWGETGGGLPAIEPTAQMPPTVPAAEGSDRGRPASSAVFSQSGAAASREAAGSPTDGLDRLIAATAMRCMQQADLLVLCLPLGVAAGEDVEALWSGYVKEVAAVGGAADRADRPPLRLVVYTKSDLWDESGRPVSSDAVGESSTQSRGKTLPARTGDRDGRPALAVSSRTGRGLAELRNRLRCIAVELRAGQGDAVASTALRCAESIEQVRTGLVEALSACRAGEGDELLAEHLRGVLDALGRIVGAVYTEELLGNIFSRFCIGK